MSSTRLTESPHLRLRPTMLSDLDFVRGVEQDARHRPFITPWACTQHEGAVRFPDSRHFIVEAGEDWNAVGFAILQGCRNFNRSIELKRIVLQTPGQGLGRACTRLLKRLAFRDLRAHRVWLDVSARNARALRLYAGEGFVEEGRLRECLRLEEGDGQAPGWDSMVLMSMLEGEYRQRVEAGREETDSGAA